MIFSELYSAYYNAVAGILAHIIRGNISEKELQKNVDRHAFSESVLTILPSLKSEKWQIIKSDMTTPVKNIPSMPVTLLEKRWLKAISLDPRIRLFDVSFEGLEDVEPLFTQEDYIVYDKYSDGDPYDDEKYISRFRTILQAIKEKKKLDIRAYNRRGKVITATVVPKCLEYSAKDDKFRLIASGVKRPNVINLARMQSCEISMEEGIAAGERKRERATVTLRIFNERNALERVMLHFAHFEKRAEKIDDDNYIVHITYDRDDETEVVIRILGFGPMVEVVEPGRFRSLIVKRLISQKNCGLF